MAAGGTHDQFRLGFLAAVDDAERGVVGGLLITNHFGRPLEFQCTTPVKPNRTQQILYGPTLRSYVMAEIVGKTLVEKVGVKPHLVLVESPDLFELRQHVALPVAALWRGEPPADDDSTRLKLGQQWLEFPADHAKDMADVRQRAAQLPATADLQEPFERIREALSETLKMAPARSA
jgi:hypothetical protein